MGCVKVISIFNVFKKGISNCSMQLFHHTSLVYDIISICSEEQMIIKTSHRKGELTF